MDLESISIENLDKETAYLLGVYLTDGSVSKRKSSFKGSEKLYEGDLFQLKAIDKDFVERTLQCIKKIIPTCIASVWEQEPRTRYWKDGRISKCQKQYCIGVGLTKSGLGNFLREQTGEKHHIPFLIWNTPLSIKRWFIAGIMDGDGYITFHTRSPGSIQWKIGIGGVKEGWIYEFRKLLNEMGIRTNKEELRKETVIGKTPFMSFRIKPYDFVKNGLFFTIKRKQDRLIKFRGTFRD